MISGLDMIFFVILSNKNHEKEFTMKLKLFYITNQLEVALAAEKEGVDRIWVDLEKIGKESRQKGDSVKSQHEISDITMIKPNLTTAEMLVRVNPWNDGLEDEIEKVINAGADIIMLPYWKTVKEVEQFLTIVDRRVKTTLLLETKEAVECIDEVLKLDFDEIHIGLNDLHLSYGLDFMFELLANGTVEMLCNKFKEKGIPYGFGGIAKLGAGMLQAEKIIMEHYRLGSTRAILSRAFCDCSKIDSITEIETCFSTNMKLLRDYEKSMQNVTEKEFEENRKEVICCVDNIVKKIRG